MTDTLADACETQTLATFSEKAYLDYSMYVILDRALPHIGDGLKPVQRRIVYAMSELGLKASAKYKKSARTVGDVLGKFHPHGDGACYEAMVLMAQDFSYRYPLVDGQGNWGSPDDPKSFAAMRYTESRLAKYADILLAELSQDTVAWLPNFDGTLDEPAMLPARAPNILLNGASGIAVGMATDIPPHNLTEVVNACILLLDNPNASLAEISKHIKGPDYPTQAEIITPKNEIKEIYSKGSGNIRQRAVYSQENDEIVITALPYQVSGAKILEQIAGQMQAKKLPLVSDLRDESDHENPTRLVIVPRSNRVDIDALMAHLFATTDLERSYRVNLNMIGSNGKPQVKPLLNILQEWLAFRTETVTRRLNFQLQKINDRLHILAGLLIVYLNLDHVIKIIRQEDEPKPVLIAKLKLSERQAEAILETKLRHLAKLEEMKLRAEQDKLTQEQKQIEKILGSHNKLKTLIKQELQDLVSEFGDKRKSPLVVREEAKAMAETDFIPNEINSVILSKKGWVRVAKGLDVDIDKLTFRAGDELSQICSGRSNQQAVFLDSTGRSYSLLIHSLPSARGYGEPLTGRISPPSGAEFIGVLAGHEEQYVALASDAGYGFITKLEELFAKNKNGKTILKLPTHAKPLPPVLINDINKDKLACISNEGRMLVFACDQLPILNKGKGNKMLSIPSSRASAREELMVAMLCLAPNQAIRIDAGRRHTSLKGKDLDDYVGERGHRGTKLPRGFQALDKATIVK